MCVCVSSYLRPLVFSAEGFVAAGGGNSPPIPLKQEAATFPCTDATLWPFDFAPANVEPPMESGRHEQGSECTVHACCGSGPQLFLFAVKFSVK